MSNLNLTLVQDVLEIALDSRSFYVKAAEVVESPELKEEFHRIAALKDALIDSLSHQLRASADAPDLTVTLAGSLRGAYAQTLAALRVPDAAAHTYTGALEESEGRLLKHYLAVMSATDSEDMRATLMEQLPKVRACHDDMKRLKAAHVA